ncbi:hypothetical protein GCM10009733_026060 [Nonomuraea maheshkhaliensis]|uniref:Class I SAM-dependent methyltransferase n=1 Tax=Nonomuraea maheshkhaliensis TaxID=419590 RepID=A0ABP4QZ59_9ACTN
MITRPLPRSRLRWYRLVYRLAYRLGLTVWQRPAPPADLITLVNRPGPLLPGMALDLGCGTGTDTVYLATHARLLLYGFSRPPKAAPMYAGLTVEEVRHRFTRAGWRLLTARRASAEALGIKVRRADARFELWCYDLERLPG